jgi:hypothetical protein
VTQLIKALLSGGSVTAALILVEHYVLRPFLTTEPQRCAARAIALNAGVSISAAMLHSPEAALVPVAISAIGNAATYGACWLDERIAQARILEQQRGAAAARWPSSNQST